MNYNKDVEQLMEMYNPILVEAAGKKCIRCGTTMGRHSDAEKAKKGYKNCPNCNMTFSPESQIKGNYAMYDKESGKIKTGKIED